MSIAQQIFASDLKQFYTVDDTDNQFCNEANSKTHLR